jgi:DNA-directed RNA polymerase specialized sigma subunit
MNEIKIYKKEVRKKYNKLSNEKLIQLRNENKIDEVVNSLLPLVINIANKYYYICDFDEIVSVGNEGLLRGIKNFDINKS